MILVALRFILLNNNPFNVFQIHILIMRTCTITLYYTSYTLYLHPGLTCALIRGNTLFSKKYIKINLGLSDISLFDLATIQTSKYR